MAKANEWKESNIPSKWTTSKEKQKQKQAGKEQGSSDDDDTPQAQKFCGWPAQGIVRYNQLFTEMKSYEREKDAYPNFERYCIEDFE
jgi:hypothetical protein